jgi:hypothetical protein
LLLVVIGLVVVVSIVAKQQGCSSGGGDWDGDDSGTSGWVGCSGRRRRCSFSFGSFGSRSRSSGWWFPPVRWPLAPRRRWLQTVVSSHLRRPR